MSEGGPQIPKADAAAVLREYLADRDVACEQCGYNLRGARGVYCPECGAVIPRPPAEDIARASMDPAGLKLWCAECDYVVTGVNAERCPECGGSALVRYSAQKPRPNRRFGWLPRGLPGTLWLNAVFGVLLAVSSLGRLMVSGTVAGRMRSALPVQLAAVGLALLPILIAFGWTANGRRIRGWSLHGRLSAAGLAFLAGMVCWMIAAALLN